MLKNLLCVAILLVSGQPQRLYNFDNFYYDSLPRTQHSRQNSEQQWPIIDAHMLPENIKNKLCPSRRFQNDNTPYEILPHQKPPQPTTRRNINVEVIKTNVDIPQSPTLDMINPSLKNSNNLIAKSLLDCLTQRNIESKLSREKNEIGSVQNNIKALQYIDGDPLLNEKLKCLTNDDKETLDSAGRLVLDDIPLVPYEGALQPLLRQNKDLSKTNYEHTLNNINTNNKLVENIRVKEPQSYSLDNGWYEGIPKHTIIPDAESKNIQNIKLQTPFDLSSDVEEYFNSTRRFISDDKPISNKGPFSPLVRNNKDLSTNSDELTLNNINKNNKLSDENVIIKGHAYSLGNGWNEGNQKYDISDNGKSKDVQNINLQTTLDLQKTVNKQSDLKNEEKLESRKYNKNVPAVQKRITKIEDQLIEAAKVYDISTSFDTSVVLLEHTRVCYACSSIGDSSCWLPNRKTTVKYCRKGHDSCVTKTYKSREGNVIVMRDCSGSCDVILPALDSNYKSCSICNVDLCNDNYIDSNGAYTNNSHNLMFIVFVIMFGKFNNYS